MKKGPNRATVIQVVELLIEHGIYFSYAGDAPRTGGFRTPAGYTLDGLDDLLAILKDRESFDAALHGLTVEGLRQYRVHDWQCRALTKAGNRCKNRVLVARNKDFVSADGFDARDDVFRFCEIHQGYLDQ